VIQDTPIAASAHVTDSAGVGYQWCLAGWSARHARPGARRTF